jgi:ABC-type phosphate/phosphonate transport system substrate-binding protein
VLAGLLAQRLPDPVPAELFQPQDLYHHWLETDLLLSQTCGYPLSTTLRHKVQIVGTFAYRAPGCEGISCRSQLIRRSSDPRTTLPQFANSTFAFNGRDSQSGFNAQRALLETSGLQDPFFQHLLESGGHNRSIEWVRTGLADLASVDCVTLALWRQANPALSDDIAVFAQTGPYPGLPLITSVHTPAPILAALRECLALVATEPQYAALCAPLWIAGFEVTTLDDYAVCLLHTQAGAAQMRAQA